MSNKFTKKAEEALCRSVKVAEELGHTYIGTEHILLSLSEDEGCCAAIILKKSKVTKDKIRSAIKEYSGVGEKTRLSAKDTTPRCRRILESSYRISQKYSSELIGTEHILLALLEERECVSSKLLLRMEADVISLKDEVLGFLRSTERGIFFSEPSLDAAIPNLMKYGKNMTRIAERGGYDPVIGRDKETERVIRILTRKTKNNPCLIGEAGVGKTAIVEGLAQRIARGDVPDVLRGKSIISIDLTSMVAGAKYRGDFEERVKSIMSEATKNKSVILFIDEIHTIVGAGSAEGAIDAANIMKPELSRGEIHLIGATTLGEYKKYIEKDGALERRFQPVLVEEPTVDGAMKILYGVKDSYEKHYGITIDEAAVRCAVTLSERYVQDRFLPDKAIDILDEACARGIVKSANNTRLTDNEDDISRQFLNKSSESVEIYAPKDTGELAEATEKVSGDVIVAEKKIRITEEDIEGVVSEITGINIADKNKDSGGNDIKRRLSGHVIGQDEAVSVLSAAVTRSLAGINDPKKPRGIFLFLGESGVGKTALAKALALELFGSEDSLIRYDMSEFSEQFSTSKLIGSAPGYVGYDDINTPLEDIRRHPYSVILFDEIEKAHPDVLALFLQIFDNGYLTDAQGRKINFRNTYIIMTSNVGSNKFDGGLGFMKNESADAIEAKLKEYFKEEFINRIDETVLFSALDTGALMDIAKAKFGELSERIEAAGLSLIVDGSVYEHLAERGKKRGFGARPMQRLIAKEIENAVAELIVSKKATRGSSIKITAISGKIEFECIASEEKMLLKL